MVRLCCSISSKLCRAYQLLDEIPVRTLHPQFRSSSEGSFYSGKWIDPSIKINISYDAFDGVLRKARTGVNLSKYDLCSALSSCTKLRNYRFGLQIHAKVTQCGHGDNLILSSALVDFYAKCNAVEFARRVFDGMIRHDQVSWTSIISCYSRCGFRVESIILFKKMLRSDIRPNCFTYVGVIAAYDQGSLLHTHVIKLGFANNVFVLSSLIDCYSKSERVDEAVAVFNAGVLSKDSIIYNSMISGYCQNSCYFEALKVFVQMRENRLKFTQFTMSIILNASGRIAVLQLGQQLHCLAIKLGFVTNVFVLSSLIDMYSKSGSIDEAHLVFKQTMEKNNVIWTSMISGFAQSGKAMDALTLFDEMMSEHLLPDHICFTAVLTACNHSGLLDRAVRYFDTMIKEYGIVPTLDQYACLVDLYARKGYLTKAVQFMDDMPFDPNCVILSSLLCCCKTYGVVKLGREIANRLFELDPHNAGAYLTMAHIYADAGLLDEVTSIRKLMKQRVSKKSAAWSWIEVDGKNVNSGVVNASATICML